MKFGTKLGMATAVVAASLIVGSMTTLVFVSDRQVQLAIDRDLVHRARTFRDGPPPPRFQQAEQPPPNQGRRRPFSIDDDNLRPRLIRQDRNTDDPTPIDESSAAHATVGIPYFSNVTLSDRHLRLITLRRDDGDYVQTAVDLEDTARIRNSQIQLVLILVPFAVLVGGAVGWIIARQALRPVSRVTLAASKVDYDSLSTRLPVDGDEEFAILASQFNQMIERLELSFDHRNQLVQKLEALLESQRAFVADASHELKTPLARLKLISTAALSQPSSPEELRAALAKVDATSDQMNGLVHQLLVLARYDSASGLTNQSCSIAEIVAHACELVESIPGPVVRVGKIPERTVVGRVDDLARALANVLENAKRYASGTADINLSVETSQGVVSLRVDDKGPGVAPEELLRLTERFFRVDDARARNLGGTGLGLAITKAIVEASGGRLELYSDVGKGMQVRFILPTCDK